MSEPFDNLTRIEIEAIVWGSIVSRAMVLNLLKKQMFRELDDVFDAENYHHSIIFSRQGRNSNLG